MPRSTSILWLLLGLVVSSGAWAAKQVSSGEYKTSVVELYTSEGCNSCPPADAFLSRLGRTAEAERIIPLAFHVDYWDYIGWKDPFASPLHTERQRLVARRNSQSTIYTPEFVVDGVEARGGRRIESEIVQTHASPAEADLVLSLSGQVDNRLTAEVSVDNIDTAISGDTVLFLAVYENALSSQVDAGENQGRELNHDFVVRYLSPAEPTRSGQQHRYQLQLGADWKQQNLGIAAFVQRTSDGRTLQAVKLSL